MYSNLRNKYSFLLLAVSLFLTGITLYAQEKEITQKIVIEDIYELETVLDEWKSPGFYSPLNMFDGDLSTCYAEGNRGGDLTIHLLLGKEIICDGIRILGGLAKTKELYEQNNRPKDFVVYLFDPNKEDTFHKALFEKRYRLSDEMEYQSMPFGEEKKIKVLSLQCLGVYKGSKYNDTCITEIKFYYKGEEIPVADIDQAKKKYVKRIGERLTTFLSYGQYEVNDSRSRMDIKLNGNAIISWVEKEKVTPSKFLTRGSKLFVVVKGKEELVKYTLYDHDRTIPMLFMDDFLKFPNGETGNLFFRPVDKKK